MLAIGIAGGKNTLTIIETLKSILGGMYSLKNYSITSLTADIGGNFDILVVDGCSIRLPAHLFETANSKVLVINSDDKELAKTLASSGACQSLVITYGLNGKACVTASSISDGLCTICVQRAFKNLSNIVRERQEFTVPAKDPLSVLAAVSAALASDVDIEAITGV